jgi:hypothetical protein
MQVCNPDEFDIRLPGQTLFVAGRKDKTAEPKPLRFTNPHIDVAYGANLAGQSNLAANHGGRRYRLFQKT